MPPKCAECGALLSYPTVNGCVLCHDKEQAGKFTLREDIEEHVGWTLGFLKFLINTDTASHSRSAAIIELDAILSSQRYDEHGEAR